MWRGKEVSTRKILFYYTLAIVLPCIALGILAFRGIRNDQALIERENQRRIQEVGEELSASLLHHLDSIEERFRKLQKKEAPFDSDLFSDSIVTEFVRSNRILLAAIPYWPSSGKMAIPGELVLYVQDESIQPPQQVLSNKATLAISTGWNYEFRDRNYSKAIRHYTSALRGLNNQLDKAMITNILARIYRKQGQSNSAIKCYQEIAEKYPKAFLSGGIPAGITATRELIKLYQGQQSLVNVQKQLIQLLKMLMEAEAPVKKAYFQNTMQEVGDWVASFDDLPADLKQELDRLEEIKTFTDYLLHFQSNGASVGNMIRNQTSPTNTSFMRSNGLPFFFGHVNEQEQNWLILYNVDRCFSDLLSRQLDERTATLGYSWQQKGTTPVSDSASEEKTAIDYTFPEHLPDWKIYFTPVRKGAMSSLFLSAQGIYLYIFLVILVILIFGLFFTLYTVNQELKLSRMKSFFISTVSHEFKSPITSIRQMAEMLDRDRISSPERKKKYYATMLHESERLSHLVENILDFARMEQGRKQYKFETGRIEKTVSNVVDTFKLQTEHKGVQLSFHAPDDLPTITYDAEAIEQVIHNLLDNASKYSGEDQRIEVSMEKSGSYIVIHVRDWGMGIPTSDQQKIFNRFYRVGDELTSSIKGSGIGLTIVRQIVDDHQGKIDLKSKPGEGSTFSIRLPTKPLK